jgi:hypothetical protein
MAFDLYSGYDDEQAALEAAAATFFEEAASSAPRGKVQAAVKTGSPLPIFNSPQWALADQRLQVAVQKVELSLLTGGLKSGASEIPGPAPRLGARIGALAEEHAGLRAVELAQAIDDKTRAGLRLMIGRASREYAKGQSLGVLRRLEGEVRASIGVTPKQAARISAWKEAAKQSGMAPDLISAGVVQRAGSARDLRARMIADRGVIESVSFGRHQSWVEARDLGELPKDVKKTWVNQGDDKVRATHRAQSRVGPIPLDDVYVIMGVMHPPSLDVGCRCHEVLFIP